MDLYSFGRTLHVSVGVVTLATFWIAALAKKGSTLHRRAGAIYLISLIAILATSSMMLVARLRVGDASTAAFISILIVFIGTSAWLAWSSIRYKRSLALLTGRVFKLLASLNLVAGVLMVGLFFVARFPLILILSSVGFVLGTTMWRLALRGPRDRRWWLEQHMNAAAVNFAATHDSFLSLAVGSVVPVLREPWPRALIAVSVLSLALVLRIWLGRLYLRFHRSAGSTSSQSGALTEETTTVRSRRSIAVLVLALGMSTATTVAPTGSANPTTALGMPARVGLGPAASECTLRFLNP
jgi:hypothetical protein